jgi:hypothetical protein
MLESPAEASSKPAAAARTTTVKGPGQNCTSFFYLRLEIPPGANAASARDMRIGG